MKRVVRLTRSFTFDMAYALYGYDGLCRNIHGHTYRLHVTIKGEPVDDKEHTRDGMVIDFRDLKKTVQENIIDIFDHALVLNGNSPHKNISGIDEHFEKVIYMPCQPTCENLILDFQQRLQNQFGNTVKLFSLKLEETPASFAEWFADDVL